MIQNDELLRTIAYKEIELHKNIVQQDKFNQKYHIMPPVGLLNDPNGFIHYKGTYHLFFQWMPFKTEHGSKFWGHYTSENLVNWTLQPIALAPSQWYDKDGCYSGSAIEHEGKLILFYTGNVMNENGDRESYQCVAESEDGIHFVKKGVIIILPEGFTPHFRDPKIFKRNKHWYMVIGTQNNNIEGNVVMYKSNNLKDWTFIGTIVNHNDLGIKEVAYMHECPDFFSLNNNDVLLFSPQGIEPEGVKYQNTYQAGYVVGKMDFNDYIFKHEKFIEIDRGFEFYAPQTTLDSKGRRIMFGWMGVPDQYENLHPTHEYKWIHNMTLPRELKLKNGKIYQIPLNELKVMRKNEINERFNINNGISKTITLASMSTEIFIDLIGLSTENTLVINFFYNYAYLTYDFKTNLLSLKRQHLDGKSMETRSCYLESLTNIHLFIDNSSLEAFINNGEEVFTSRIFPSHNNKDLFFTSKEELTLDIKIWDL